MAESFKLILEELAATFSTDTSESEQLAKVLNSLETLLLQIENADDPAITQVLDDFQHKTEKSILKDIGKLLRGFYDRLHAIPEGFPQAFDKLSNQDVADMSDKLQHVVEMTDKAANKTLDLTEEIMADLDTQNDSCAKTIEFLNNTIEGGNIPAGVKDVLSATVSQIQESVNRNTQLQDKLTEILIAQDYQDLTGQVIQKLLVLLKTLEEDLASLLRKYSTMNDGEGEDEENVRLHGPLTDHDEEKTSQTDVDSLLADFGF